jgi:hypothetical protein
MKSNSPMRIPKSPRAKGTDGFRISSLKETTTKDQISQGGEIPDVIWVEGDRFAHQILLMSSLLSHLWVIYESSITTILRGGSKGSQRRTWHDGGDTGGGRGA